MPREDQVVRGLGGLARTADLLALGREPDLIQMAVYYGRLIRVRRGWFAVPETPASVLDACRVGGRLACVSALEYHGVLSESPERLHVAVPRSASRLRDIGRDVTVHWTRAELSGDHCAVAIDVALEQARSCAAIIDQRCATTNLKSCDCGSRTPNGGPILRR